MKSAVKKKRGQPAKIHRNAAVLSYYRAGHTVREVAAEFEMTPQRVGQLVRGIRSAAETRRLKRV